MSRREAERTLNLLRRIDMEEVLDELGIEILYTKGSDGYAECPDPEHVDGNPSFHVCLQEVLDDRGRNRLGWFHCWSHDKGTGSDLRGVSFLDLVARIRKGIWDRSTSDAEREEAARWIRDRYVRGTATSSLTDREYRPRPQRVTEQRALTWPPSTGITEGDDDRFRRYLSRRGFPLDRAAELGVRAVRRAGEVENLRRTVPAVLFPIVHNGEVVNWYARSIIRFIDSKNKGRYASGIELGAAGVFWSPDGPDLREPVAIVEGIFDAESVRRVLLNAGDSFPVRARNVLAVLGGNLHRAQAQRLKDCPRVYVMGDGDDGGEHLLTSARRVLEGDVVVDALMPEGKDPDSAEPEEIIDSLERASAPPRERRATGARMRRWAR